MDRAELSDPVRHCIDCSYKFVRFGRRDPGDGEPLFIVPKIIKEFGDHGGTGLCFIITIQVMTFAEVSAKDHYAIGPLVEGVQNKFRVNHP